MLNYSFTSQSFRSYLTTAHTGTHLIMSGWPANMATRGAKRAVQLAYGVDA